MPTPIKKNKSFGVLKSDANRPKDKPLVGPKNLNKKKVAELNSKIVSLEKSFNSEERRYRAKGNAGFSVGMRRYSKEATKINKELINLTGKGSSFYESKREK